MAAVCGFVVFTHPSLAGASSGKVAISSVTVTAAVRGSDSAVVLHLHNGTAKPLLLLSIKSPAAARHMIGYDTNMCQGNQAMVALANILVIAGNTQNLGYRFQGAMLGGVRRSLLIGQRVPLVITWSDFSVVHKTNITATVVKPPKGLRFIMTGMKM